MEVAQNSPKQTLSTDETLKIIPYSELSPQQQMYIDYCTIQGVITNDDGTGHRDPNDPKVVKLSLEKFAEQIGVDRKTLYNWKTSIPNFWDLVNERRQMINSGARLQKVWNALFLAATAKLDVRAIQTYLANTDPNFRMPTQPVKHEAGGSLADVLELARQRRIDPTTVVEGEVVKDATNDTQAS